jgi:dihydroorotate dehydrogenase electron transfer subunit
LFAARRLRESAGPDGEVKITALLGYRDEPYYAEELGGYCDEVFAVSETWEDGGARGPRGTVMDLIARLESKGELDLSGASVLSCGPTPLLRAVSAWAAARALPAQVSLEERMGCGYGACVGCTIAVKAGDAGVSAGSRDAAAAASGVIRLKVCKDGPVFPSDLILW